jgi:2-keto-4-pentenoate hydratase/2-oxohepta-3-ene-1,7-dioic acid hydratase in catechol pathway
MRLATFGGGRVGIVEGDQITDVTSAVPAAGEDTDVMVALIKEWQSLRNTLPIAGAATCRLSDVVLEPPVRKPSKIVAAPVNYLDHMDEMSESRSISALGVFLKAPSSLIGHGGSIELPYVDRRFDQEAEFAFIIGKRARNVSRADALDHVFGYTCLLDITMRGGEDRSTRKSFDTFTPLGPWIVTADEIGDPTDVELAGWVNGTLRQRANTRDLIWGVAALLEYASSVMTLDVGDVVTTGTPAGVGVIVAGDQIEMSLSGIGRLAVDGAATLATVCPTRGADAGPVPPATVTPIGR